MSEVRELKEQALRVREYWRSPPSGKHLSAEGATLLSLVENLPHQAFVIEVATLKRWLIQGLECQDEIAAMLRRAGIPR